MPRVMHRRRGEHRWCSLLWVCLVGCLNLEAARAEDGFRDDFDTITDWTARPDWLAPHAERVSLTTSQGVATFTVSEPGRGMKWWRPLPDRVELELSPWLVMRYRAEHLDLSAPEYLVWLKDATTSKDGLRVLYGNHLQGDGQWHTVAVNLLDFEAASPATAIAVQCWADASGTGSLQIDFVALTDTPPDDAEWLPAPVPPTFQREIDMRDPNAWTVQPSWLGNYSANHRVSQTAQGLEFAVQEGLAGAKWSRALAEPIEGARFVSMRYRARHLRNSSDYVLYAGVADAANTEQYVIRESDLVADGQWHVVIAKVTLSTIRQLALQVQAVQNEARFEVAEVRFTDAKPVASLSDLFDYEPTWPSSLATFQPIALPPGNLSGKRLAGRLGVRDWLSADHISAATVPFLVRSGADAILDTRIRQPDQIRFDVTGQASELYLLLAAQFPLVDEPSYGGSGSQVRHVHRFVARIDYGDGLSEEQFPLAVAAREHAISRGLHVYSLAIDPAKQLRGVTLFDNMARGSFALLAATLGTEPGPATESTRLRRTAPLALRSPSAERRPEITQRGTSAEIISKSLSMDLEWSKGLHVVRLVNQYGDAITDTAIPTSLFRLSGKDAEYSSSDFAVTQAELEEVKSGKRLRIDLTCAKRAEIKVSIRLDVIDECEIGMTAHVTLGDLDPATTSFVFPELGGLEFGGAAEDVWVWCPRRGDVITSEGISLREPYAGAGNPLQIVGAFETTQGTGLYMMTQDLEGRSKFYQVQKDARGARLAVEYLPLFESRTPRTVIGCAEGDWHAQLARYREWVATWYTPAAPRKAWFRRVWNFRQQFMHFALPSPSGIFDLSTRQIKLKEVVQADAEAFGGVDYLHLFDWGWDPVHGRCGDYEPWEYLGGVDPFRRAVSDVQALQIPVGLYIEGILVDPQSNLGKAHGEAWQMLGPAGKPYTYFAPSFHICPRIPAWQDYLSGTYGRVRAETGADGFYIDEYGFSGPTYWCYNPSHAHDVPVTPVLGERDMLRKVRDELGPEAAIYTEESPTDVNSQYQDGSFTYNISSVSDALSPSHVNLYRFVFPDFKTIEIICCDQPLGTNVEAVKRCLFNGEAIWIEGIRDKWFSPQVRAEIARNRKVMRENEDCFACDNVQPLMPTLVDGIYANQFGPPADAPVKACWTIYNTMYRTVCDELIAVPHTEGTSYWDAISGRPVPFRVEGDRAFLHLSLAPRDVTVVSRK